MKSFFIILAMFMAAFICTTHAIPFPSLIEWLDNRDQSFMVADYTNPVLISRTVKDAEKPLSFEEEYTTPGGTHIKKGGYYDPNSGSRGSYSSSSFHKEWHS